MNRSVIAEKIHNLRYLLYDRVGESHSLHLFQISAESLLWRDQQAFFFLEHKS